MINRRRNLDDLLNRSCPPCYLQHGRVYTNHLNPDTIDDFAGTLEVVQWAIHEAGLRLLSGPPPKTDVS
jgi:hypothetical protein